MLLLQQDLAVKTQKSVKYVSTLRMLERIAHTFDMNVTELLKGN